MKVYCKNCKWHYELAFGSFAYDCRVIDKSIKTPIGHSQKTFQVCCEQNKNYNCKDYKKKWYIFWVK